MSGTKKCLEEKTKADVYTDEEINELAEWFSALTIQQVFFLKQSYEEFTAVMQKECGSEYVQ